MNRKQENAMKTLWRLALAALLALPLAAVAQAYPSKPIRIVVPFPAGGIVDSVARRIGEKMSAKYRKRIVSHPDLPTVSEAAGLPNYSVDPFTAVFVPAKTLEDIVRKLAADMMEILAMPDVKERMDFIGMELNLQPTREFDTFVHEESIRWKGVIEKAGIVAK